MAISLGCITRLDGGELKSLHTDRLALMLPLTLIPFTRAEFFLINFCQCQTSGYLIIYQQVKKINSPLVRT